MNVFLKAFVCDAPARSFIKCTKTHGGYSACEKCTVSGEYYENRVVYKTDKSEVERTNVSFRAHTDEDHHIAESPLIKLPVDLISVFPYEYMHLMCLGVTRKLITLWTRGKVNVFRLSAKQVDSISEKLLKLKPQIPLEFNRKPRSLRDIDRWKATEFRQFLLYTGPIVLVNVLPEEHYSLFMCFHVAARILASADFCSNLNGYAFSLLQYFVEGFEKLYGKENISYNVHGLLHIHQDVRNLGRLDSFSAFRFENHLGKIKKLLRNPNNSLSQIHRRLSERRASIQVKSNITTQDFVPLKSHSEGPLVIGTRGPQYKILKYKTFELKCDGRCNNAVQLQDNSLAIVRNIATTISGSIVLIIQKYKTQNTLYSSPCASSEISVYSTCDGDLEDLEIVDFTFVKHKCMLLPSDSENFAFFPLVHLT